MKKLLRFIALGLSLITLSACSLVSVSTTNSSSSSASSSVQKETAELIIKEDDKTLTKTVSFEEGATVLEVLKANYDVEENQGFITSIDGIQQDEAAQKYWMYKVNGELASKGAGELVVKADDKIEFYQEVYSN